MKHPGRFDITREELEEYERTKQAKWDSRMARRDRARNEIQGLITAMMAEADRAKRRGLESDRRTRERRTS